MVDEMKKIDLYKQLKAEYKAGSKPAFIETTPGQYLSIEGQGAPGGDMMVDCIGALYSMAFTIKMTRKAAGLDDYVVCKLETLWYTPDGGDDPSKFPRDQWCWTIMIRTPDCVSQDDLDAAAKVLMDKGKCDSVKKVKLTSLNEGQCVQMLHIGPHEREGETVEIMRAFAEENGKTFTAKHHDIYLSDPRCIAPEKLKTIVRRPVI